MYAYDGNYLEWFMKLDRKLINVTEIQTSRILSNLEVK